MRGGTERRNRIGGRGGEGECRVGTEQASPAESPLPRKRKDTRGSRVGIGRRSIPAKALA